MNKNQRLLGSGLIAATLVLAACSTPAAPAAPSAAMSAPEQVAATPQPVADANASQDNLAAIKTYLVGKTNDLKSSTAKLKSLTDQYYEAAKTAQFDYNVLWSSKKDEVTKLVQDARVAWVEASPRYEQMEGIVAGTPSLSQFDVDMDAGSSATDGGDNVVSFDLKLPDGATLPKPGNLFGVTESALWGTFSDYDVKGLQADFNGDGKVEFGEVLPDANILKAAADLLDAKAGELAEAASAWQPTETEAFGALVANVPTVSDFIESWKNSRFVATDPAKASRDFAVISRLSDIVDNIGSWQTIYDGLSPAVVKTDATADSQIKNQLADLKQFIADVYQKEQGGRRYTPEEADTLGKEAQDRATAITGQITQMAAKLNVKLEQ